MAGNGLAGNGLAGNRVTGNRPSPESVTMALVASRYLHTYSYILEVREPVSELPGETVTRLPGYPLTSQHGYPA